MTLALRSIGILLLLATSSAAAERPRPPLLLVGAEVLDAAGTKLLTGQQLVIDDGKIIRIASNAEPLPPGTQRIDLSGLTLVPGLIDLHSHLLLHPYNEAPWDDQVLKENVALRTARAVAAARATLDAGFTTLRDLGTEGAGYADVGLRDAIESGIIPGPRVFASTRAIVASGCYAPQGYDPRWDMPIGAQVADGIEGVRVAVRQQIAGGADWIKFYADYHRRPGAPTTPTFSQEEMNAIVAEAASARIPVAAHATSSEGIRRAVHAGVKTIEHGYEASDEVLALMKQRGVALCPTLAASEAYEIYAGWKPGTPEPERLKRTRENFVRALKSGVIIANGSDVGVFPHGENIRELELLVAWGMSPVDALRAATATAAKVLGREADLGRIAIGAHADLVAVNGNPLTDVQSLKSPVVVIKNGRVEKR